MSEQTYQRWIFIFRQDLRLHDNTGLKAIYKACKEVVPIFVFDTEVLAHFPAPDARRGFLLDSLQWLKKELKKNNIDLIVLYGEASTLIPLFAKTIHADALYRNRSYGTWSRTRDETILQRANVNDVAVHTYHDYLLAEPQAIEIRKVFTPYYHLWQQTPKDLPLDERPQRSPSPDIWPLLKNTTIQPLDIQNKHDVLKQIWWILASYRWRNHAEQQWSTFSLAWYDETRNRPDLEKTSQLSPYLRFGILSPRQLLTKHIKLDDPSIVWNQDTMTITMNKKLFHNSFVSELAWRDFRRHIDHHFPESRLVEFQEKRRGIQRRNNPERFAARQESRTGYPIIDAGMRQLKSMNRMHGRVRMIVASFLCKDLLIDRKRWEQHFADRLIDYDEAVNRGNRQWSASVGADPKPLRIFNPILQSQKFDPDATYIKKWIPELAHHSPAQLHDPLTHTLDRHTPIVNHYEMSKKAKQLYACKMVLYSK